MFATSGLGGRYNVAACGSFGYQFVATGYSPYYQDHPHYIPSVQTYPEPEVTIEVAPHRNPNGYRQRKLKARLNALDTPSDAKPNRR